MFLPQFDVLCDLLLDRCTATWNLFVLYNKEWNFVRIKAASRESGTFPILTNTKKAIWRHLWSIQNEAISLVAMRSKGLWLVQENHATVKLDLSVASRGMKTCSETRIELRNLQILKKLPDNSSQFLSSDQPSEPKNLPWILQELKKYAWKTCDCGQSGGHSIRVLNRKER